MWGLVPEDLARGYLAVALERRDDGVVVAMDDPGDEQVLAALEADLGTRSTRSWRCATTSCA